MACQNEVQENSSVSYITNFFGGEVLYLVLACTTIFCFINTGVANRDIDINYIIYKPNSGTWNRYKVYSQFISLPITRKIPWPRDYKTNTQITKELKITPILEKLLEYKRNWIQHIDRMPHNRLPRVRKHYSPTGRRNYGRPLKRLLDTWDQNWSTSGPAPWQTYDDDDSLAKVPLFWNFEKQLLSRMSNLSDFHQLKMARNGYLTRLCNWTAIPIHGAKSQKHFKKFHTYYFCTSNISTIISWSNLPSAPLSFCLITGSRPNRGLV
jgi:hypothetical protein